jgi:hypothetical protein
MLGFSPISGAPISGYADQSSGATLVSADLAASYGILALVAADLSASYAIWHLVSADLDGSYAIGADGILVSADLPVTYTIRSFVSADLAGSYAVESNTTFTRAPGGDGYRPRTQAKTSRPADLQGYKR